MKNLGRYALIKGELYDEIIDSKLINDFPKSIKIVVKVGNVQKNIMSDVRDMIIERKI